MKQNAHNNSNNDNNIFKAAKCLYGSEQCVLSDVYFVMQCSVSENAEKEAKKERENEKSQDQSTVHFDTPTHIIYSYVHITYIGLYYYCMNIIIR